MAPSYKPLTEADIKTLAANGCRADDWKNVQVTEGFDARLVLNTTFKGTIRIGSLRGEWKTVDGLPAEALISGATLINVTVGNNCHIRNIGAGIMNMDIEDEVIIVNTGRIACTGESSFGNGEELAVLNEGGGRELRITELTSAQTAYLTVLYRHNKELVAKLDGMARAFAASRKSGRGRIGLRAQVLNSGKLTNVNIGPYAVLNGVASLENGTIVSEEKAAVTIENGVTAKGFIVQKGAKVSDQALLHGVLVGEGVRMGKQFSAENSVFFANCEGFHSEACSIFAGPYTVTHHRSTLLIAGLFSFYNAGSGTNQSNHMYKLGPLHQGTLERGCKTGSFSYLLWPSRVGAFTAVIGKHYANFDTADLPFSYISDDDGRSVITPGMNFFTVGTMRDGAKWPARDRRTNADKFDLIIFDVLSPYTAQKMQNGERILGELAEKATRDQEFVTYNGISIKRLLLKTCKRYYRMALDKYFGDAVIRRVDEQKAKKLKDVFKPDPKGGTGTEEWVDVCGLLCTKPRLDAFIAEIVSGKRDTLVKVQEGLAAIHAAYRADEWNWVLATYQKTTGTALAAETGEKLAAFMDQWRKSSVKLFKMVIGDASKEFEGTVRTGFGIDGNADADFAAVRGSFEGNSFVKSLNKNITDAESTCARLKAMI
ncbi:MAG: DUF4954 family protein [Planctomycetota bacterium]